MLNSAKVGIFCQQFTKVRHLLVARYHLHLIHKLAILLVLFLSNLLLSTSLTTTLDNFFVVSHRKVLLKKNVALTTINQVALHIDCQLALCTSSQIDYIDLLKHP